MIDDIEGVGSDSFPVPDEQQIPPITEETDEQPVAQDGSGEAAETKGEEGEQPEKPKGKSFQERIDEITDDKYAERRRAEAAEARLAALEVAKPENQSPADDAPDPNDEVKYPFGVDDPQFMRDSLRHEMRQELAQQRQQQQAENAVALLETKYSERVARAREEIPDYDEVVTKTAARGEWPLSPLLALAAKDSEVGPKVLHHLATNREEAIQIANMSSPYEQAMAFGRLEAKFLNQPSPQPNIATNAPEPAQARTKGGQFAAPSGLDDRLSQDEWLRRRNAQLAGK